MKLTASVLSTLAIAATTWGLLMLQKTGSPTEEQKYASAKYSAEELDLVAWESIKTAGSPVDSVQRHAAASSESPSQSVQSEVLSSLDQSLPAEQKRTQSSKGSSKKTQQTSLTSIVGLQKTISLSELDALWQLFTQNESLNQQLQQNKFTIVVVYRDFNADFSRAQVTIGYQIETLQGTTFTLPTGKRTPLLGQGTHDNSALMHAWENIDYRRDITAVIEQHFYDNGRTTARVDVIYP